VPDGVLGTGWTAACGQANSHERGAAGRLGHSLYMALRSVDCVLPPLYLLKEYLTFFHRCFDAQSAWGPACPAR
jgi:hypothetical protein